MRLHPRTLIGLCCIAALPSLRGVASAVPTKARPSPSVEAVIVEAGKPARASVRCLGDDGGVVVLDLDPGIVPYGVKPVGEHAAVSLSRKDGLIACNATPAARGGLRLRSLSIRAVSPSAPHDDKTPRVVLAIDGQALGPRLAADDDVYLVWRGAIVAASALAPPACPEARWSDERVVVCLDPARLRGRGPARVRLQSAGRVAEAAGAPIELLPPSGSPR